ncbi:LysR family transcriptional regulator [Vibrio sp. S4M6]|uniref:LysR family transcriptional regulator n=1 Tax=Vibrio sinus TaxID=2946865 RepID=UPI00202A29BB|nr:LysR family transcriptional regulator [Vibrio sinus]MCL9780934.1 LysR family transcriptional regulator [Vibrio sinus]
MYNIDKLRMFVEAAELGSFSAAARKLAKVQSAISQGISDLEIDFNVQLFDRSTRKPTLTKAGKQLFKQAKVVILQAEELSATAHSINNREEDIIRLTLDDALFMPSLFRILGDFSQVFPSTEIEIIAVSSTDVIPIIGEQRADIGLMFTDLNPYKDIDPCFIGNLRFSSVCHPKHDLAQVGDISFPELVCYRQLVVRGYEEKSIWQLPVSTGKVYWSNSFNSVKEMLIHGNMGWAYLPSHLVQADIDNQRLAEISISFDHKAWTPPVDLVVSKLKAKGPALSWLEKKLKTLLD